MKLNKALLLAALLTPVLLANAHEYQAGDLHIAGNAGHEHEDE